MTIKLINLTESGAGWLVNGYRKFPSEETVCIIIGVNFTIYVVLVDTQVWVDDTDFIF